MVFCFVYLIAFPTCLNFLCYVAVTLLNVDFYHEAMKPIFAEWSYLWLQKQHIHGIERHETLTYILEGASARSDSTGKVSLLELGLIEAKVRVGDLSPTPAPTLAHQRSLSNEGLAELEREREAARLAVISSLTTGDPDVEQLNELQMKHLEKARAVSTIQRDMVFKVVIVRKTFC